MILRFSISFVFLFSVFELFSQGDYRPGFIVSLEKDTISGFILYKENDSRFSICSFRKAPDAESTAYTPLKIIGYGFQNDSYYVSREITINFEKRIFFAEILVSGRSTLLKVTKDFYLEDSENSIYELAKVITEVTNDKGRFLKTNDVYKGILNWKFADCPEVARKTSSLKFEEAALTRIFEQYNACSGQVQKSFKSVKPWSEISIGLSGGLAKTTLKNLETTNFYNIINEEQFKSDLGLFGGATFQFSSPRISERFSINIDLLYQRVSHESLLTTGDSYDVVYLQYDALQIPISFCYLFNNSRIKIKPSIEIGMNFSYTMNATSFWQAENTGPTTVITERTNNIIATNNVLMAPFIGASASREINNRTRLFLRLRYQYGLSVIDNGVVIVPQQNISITTGLLIKVTR